MAQNDSGNIIFTAGLLATESAIFKDVQGTSSSEDALYEPLIFILQRAHLGSFKRAPTMFVLN
jgi:hypothetical protein